MRVYELIQALSTYGPDVLVEVLLPSDNRIDTVDVVHVNGSAIAIVADVEDSDLARWYGEDK